MHAITDSQPSETLIKPIERRAQILCTSDNDNARLPLRAKQMQLSVFVVDM